MTFFRTDAGESAGPARNCCSPCGFAIVVVIVLLLIALGIVF
jgi:hypothetical protein